MLSWLLRLKCIPQSGNTLRSLLTRISFAACENCFHTTKLSITVSKSRLLTRKGSRAEHKASDGQHYIVVLLFKCS